MSGSSRALNRTPRLELVLLLIAAVFLRVLGPTIALPERDGFAALCTGTDIVYLPSDPDGASHPGDGGGSGDDGPEHVPCIWLGHHLAIVPAVVAVTLAAGRLPTPDALPEHPVRLFGGDGSYRSRAPPVPSP
jgi:hypothetical protein